jgi:nucleotide-binding universal stress UspA family protein
MYTIETIVHPTDFWEGEQRAFDLACDLAREHNARLVLLHVLETPVAVYLGGPIIPEVEEDLETAVNRLRELGARVQGLHVECRLATGNADAEILRVAEEEHGDLIVMATHGLTGVARLLLGSVTEQVVRRSSIPVLTVKAVVPQTRPVAGRQQEMVLTPV